MTGSINNIRKNKTKKKDQIKSFNITKKDIKYLKNK